MVESRDLTDVAGRLGAALKRGPDWLWRYLLALAALTFAYLLAALLLRTMGPQMTIVVSLLGDLVFLGAAWLGYGPGLLVGTLLTFVVPRFLVPGEPPNADFGRFGVLLFMSILISRVSSSKRRSET